MVNLPNFETRTCPACFSDQFKNEPLLPELVVSQCLGCGLFTSTIFNLKKPVSDSNKVNQRAYQASIGEVRKAQAKKIISLVSKYDNNKANWVDIGCGFGYMLDEAKTAGYKIFGIEPNQQAFENACILLGKEAVHNGILTESILQNESVDVISLLDVLEHAAVSNLESFIPLIRKKMRTDGLLVVKVPSTEGVYFQAAHKLSTLVRLFAPGIFKRFWQTTNEFPHTVYFNSKNLTLLLKKFQFNILDLKYLEEVPAKTIIDRLLLDDSIPKPLAYLLAPAVYILSLMEKFRSETDTLVIIARKPHET